MRQRRYVTQSEMEEVWDRWEHGESLNSIARGLERGRSAVQGMLSRTGGIRATPKCPSRLALTLAEREETSRGIAAGHSMREIAAQLDRAPSTISREISRNGGCGRYRANQADEAAWQRGSNENTNGPLRQYFPKGMDLSNVHQNRLNAVARELNERPRETLNFYSPAEKFNECVASTG